VRRLGQHNWPGNVRELRNVLERAAAIAASEVIDAALIGRAMPHAPAPAPTAERPADLAATIAAAERQALLDAIAASNGSKSAAARRLGVSRSQFYEKLKRHSL